MLTHIQIWTALDRLAERAGLSPSGLAKKSGLDPTTFNKSKRITTDGRERWPSTESVAKALAATNTAIDSFVQLIEDGARIPELLVDVGGADPFLEKELRPDLLERACADAGIPLTLRRQTGYDHSYYFVSTFLAEHVAWHAERL